MNQRPLVVLFACLALVRCSSSTPPAEVETAEKGPQVSAAGLWEPIPTESAGAASVDGTERPAEADRFEYAYRLDRGRLSEVLYELSSEVPASALIDLPVGDRIEVFRIEPSPFVSDALSEWFPGITSYRAQGVSDPTATARFETGPDGFSGMVLSASGAVVLAPGEEDAARVMAVVKDRAPAAESVFACRFAAASSEPRRTPPGSRRSPDGLRHYRLAVAATGEYTKHLGGADRARRQIRRTVNNLNVIYEREVGVRFDLVAIRVHDGPATDPYANGASVDVALLRENQQVLDRFVGGENYDIGHLFSRAPANGGGLAQRPSVCDPNTKAQGATSLPTPSGYAFDVDYVAHEIGHQLGADHTFSSERGACRGNRFDPTAYEPGSGSTIMSYAGICEEDNVQAHAHDYFHAASLEQMWDNLRGEGAACGALEANGNRPPELTVEPELTVPPDTPFRLPARARDPEGDAVTYGWDQFDPPGTPGPLIRSRPPSHEPFRVIPDPVAFYADRATPFERLPGSATQLRFRVVARDNRAGGGAASLGTTIVHVRGKPLVVEYPDEGARLRAGDPLTIRWRGGEAGNVDILLSQDGGSTFVPLVEATDNDGSETVEVPVAITSHARLEIRPENRVYFAVSPEFAIAR